MHKTRHSLTFCLVLLGLAFALNACNRNPTVQAAHDEGQRPAATPAEQDFMIKAAQANLTEIDMARIVMQKSQNEDVRDFANMIQKDHTDALEDLTDLMRDKQMSPPNTLSPETKADIEKMTALTGPELDREFANAMVADHQKALEMFRDRANIAQDPDVRKYAEDLIPKLEMHLEKAEQLQSKLFGGGRP